MLEINIKCEDATVVAAFKEFKETVVSLQTADKTYDVKRQAIEADKSAKQEFNETLRELGPMALGVVKNLTSNKEVIQKVAEDIINELFNRIVCFIEKNKPAEQENEATEQAPESNASETE